MCDFRSEKNLKRHLLLGYEKELVRPVVTSAEAICKYIAIATRQCVNVVPMREVKRACSACSGTTV